MAEQVAAGAEAPRGARRQRIVVALLALACLVSAFAVIYSAHRSRELFRQLESARREQNEIQVEWRQLLLERSTQSSHARVEAIAGAQLGMKPVEGEIRTVVVQ